MGATPGRTRTADAMPRGRAKDACPPARRGVAAGFTLLELMIVVVIAAVVLAIGGPGFTEFRRNNRLTSAANDFLAASTLARTEAIKRQRRVSVCASADTDAGAAATCSGGAFTGWLVFVDANGDCLRDAGEGRIASATALHRDIRARSAGFCASFEPTGFAAALPAGTGVDRVLFCDERGLALQAGTDQSAARGIVVSRTGRAFLTRDPERLDEWGFTCP